MFLYLIVSLIYAYPFFFVRYHHNTNYIYLSIYLSIQIVGALKTNNAGLLVLHMENCAADFLDKYNIPSLFPTKALLTPGAMMEEDNWGPMVKSSERQHGFFIPNENFRVVVVSHFQLEDYEEFLQNSLPLELLAPIEITPAGE